MIQFYKTELLRFSAKSGIWDGGENCIAWDNISSCFASQFLDNRSNGIHLALSLDEFPAIVYSSTLALTKPFLLKRTDGVLLAIQEPVTKEVTWFKTPKDLDTCFIEIADDDLQVVFISEFFTYKEDLVNLIKFEYINALRRRSVWWLENSELLPMTPNQNSTFIETANGQNKRVSSRPTRIKNIQILNCPDWLLTNISLVLMTARKGELKLQNTFIELDAEVNFSPSENSFFFTLKISYTDFYKSEFVNSNNLGNESFGLKVDTGKSLEVDSDQFNKYGLGI